MESLSDYPLTSNFVSFHNIQVSAYSLNDFLIFNFSKVFRAYYPDKFIKGWDIYTRPFRES